MEHDRSAFVMSLPTEPGTQSPSRCNPQMVTTVVVSPMRARLHGLPDHPVAVVGYEPGPIPPGPIRVSLMAYAGAAKEPALQRTQLWCSGGGE